MKLELLYEMVTQALDEAANTLGADINEIMTGYFLAGSSWSKFGNGAEAKKAVDERKKQVSPEELKDQVGRAKAMAEEVLAWASANGYDGTVQKVWWTARPGILSKAVNREVDSRKNPTDILLDFGGGEFLGVSAKSTKGGGDIGFKNPGIGTLSKNLGVDFAALTSEIEMQMIKKYKLPEGIKARKIYIRANPKIQQKTIEAGTKMLNILQSALHKNLSSLDQKALRKHLLTAWLDAEGADPYYIKVTGHGKNGNYSADVMDPMNNEKLKLINNGKLQVTPVGNDSVGVLADGHRIMKMRFKFESEKLASSIKLSGDPWAAGKKGSVDENDVLPSDEQAPVTFVSRKDLSPDLEKIPLFYGKLS